MATSVLRVHKQHFRFALVGTINTVVDIGIYSLLTNLSVNLVVANFFSTSCGIVVSYLLNRTFTFRSSSEKIKRELGLFLAITLIGLWLIQPAIILLITHQASSILMRLPPSIDKIPPKIIATVAGLIWNYVWYSQVVFKKMADDEKP